MKMIRAILYATLIIGMTYKGQQNVQGTQEVQKLQGTNSCGRASFETEASDFNYQSKALRRNSGRWGLHQLQ